MRWAGRPPFLVLGCLRDMGRLTQMDESWRKMKVGSMTDRLWADVESYVAAERIELDDLEVLGEGPAKIVRVTVDGEGLGVDRIADLSRGLSRIFDEIDPFDGAYTLEVSSPGLEREFTAVKKMLEHLVHKQQHQHLYLHQLQRRHHGHHPAYRQYQYHPLLQRQQFDQPHRRQHYLPHRPDRQWYHLSLRQLGAA